MSEESEILNMTETVIMLMEDCQFNGAGDDFILQILEEFCEKSRSGLIGGDPNNIH